MALAQRCGLGALLGDRLTVAAAGGANAAAKILALVAGMVCGADSIDDMDLLRHGGMGRLFLVRAPSTLGTFLRPFTFGHVRQLDAVAAGLLTRLAASTPALPGADQLGSRHRPLPPPLPGAERGQRGPRPPAWSGRASERPAQIPEGPPPDPQLPQPSNEPRQGRNAADPDQLRSSWKGLICRARMPGPTKRRVGGRCSGG
jgi:hypothetical protein